MRAFLLSLILLAAGCVLLWNTEPLEGEDLAAYQACTTDSDCTIVANGCCCGTAAINRTKEQDFADRFQCEHSNTMCDCVPQDPKTHAVCTAKTCAIVK